MTYDPQQEEIRRRQPTWPGGYGTAPGSPAMGPPIQNLPPPTAAPPIPPAGVPLPPQGGPGGIPTPPSPDQPGAPLTPTAPAFGPLDALNAIFSWLGKPGDLLAAQMGGPKSSGLQGGGDIANKNPAASTQDFGDAMPWQRSASEREKQ